MALKFLNNGYFAGKVGIGTESPKQQLHVSSGTTAGDVTKMVIGATGGNAESYLYLAELFSGDNVNYGFSFVADGNSSNNLLFKRHSNSTSGTTVMEIRRDSDQIRFNGYSGTNQTGTPTYILGTTNGGDIVKVLGADIPGVPAGSGTLNTVTMWTPDGDTLGNSPITISGNNSSFAGGITATYGNFSSAVNALYFRTAAANTDYNLFTRNNTGNTIFVQAAQSNASQPIAKFSYGSATVNAGTAVLQVSKDNSHFVNCNVGIGTISPQRLLQLRSTNEATGIFLERTSNYGFVQYNQVVGSVETYHLGFVN